MIENLAEARQERAGRFCIAKLHGSYSVYERGSDGIFEPWHMSGVSHEAAKRLRADLASAKVSFPDGLSKEGIATRYHHAVAFLPFLSDCPDPWAIAMQIAEAQPWHDYVQMRDTEIPF